MLIFLDFETSGLPDREKMMDLSDPSHPHVASVALMAFSADFQHHVGSFYAMVTPDGWEMNPETSQVNGLYTENLQAHGIRIKTVMNTLDAWLYKATQVITYNAKFDGFMYDLEAHRLSRPCYMVPERRCCAMLSCAEEMKLPGRYGDWAWPALETAYQHFMGKEMENAHNGLWDVHNLTDIVRVLVERGLWNL